MNIKLKRNLQLALPPALATVSLFASQANAATLSFSRVSLELNAFTQSAQNVSDKADASAIAIANGDLVTVDIDFTSIFSNKVSQVFANSDAAIELTGQGSRFFGQVQILSQLIGLFEVSAGQVFSFNFDVSLNLKNSVDSPQSGSVITHGGVSFFLIDEPNQNFLGGLNIVSNLNTYSPNNPDDVFPIPETTDNIFITDNSSQNTSSPLIKSAQATVTGTFQQRFNEDTQIRLIAQTTQESCVQAPRVNDACVKVSEPTNIIALMIFGSWLSVLSSIMKQVIQLAR